MASPKHTPRKWAAPSATNYTSSPEVTTKSNRRSSLCKNGRHSGCPEWSSSRCPTLPPTCPFRTWM